VNEQSVSVAGIIESVRVLTTKQKQEPMAIVKLTDISGSMEVVAFPKAYKEIKGLLNIDSIVVINGKLSNRNEEINLLADTATLIRAA
jgi:DNA polymerase-3 subunit alpha